MYFHLEPRLNNVFNQNGGPSYLGGGAPASPLSSEVTVIWMQKALASCCATRRLLGCTPLLG